MSSFFLINVQCSTLNKCAVSVYCVGHSTVLIHMTRYIGNTSKIKKYEKIMDKFRYILDFLHIHSLAVNPQKFNQDLIDYLLWYNTERPHWSLELKSPLQYLFSQDLIPFNFILNQNPQKSKIGWTYTYY